MGPTDQSSVVQTANGATSKRPVLVGDIGGTRSRFAMLADGKLSPIETFANADLPGFAEAIRAFSLSPELRGARAIFGLAGPIEDGGCLLSNRGWRIDAAQLQREFGFARVDLLNDFAPVAWSLPVLAPGDLFQIGGGERRHGAPAAVLGPGTGLGVACLAGEADRAMVFQSEGGHATVPGADLREDAVIARLRDRFGHVSVERVLSGPGLVNLYRAMAEMDGAIVPSRNPEEITAAACGGTCAFSQSVLDMFCAMLGTFAGDMALTFGARGGVFIAGGVVPHFRDYLARSAFRARFEAKGRLSHYLSAIPAFVITHKAPAFIGLRVLAEQP